MKIRDKKTENKMRTLFIFFANENKVMNSIFFFCYWKENPLCDNKIISIFLDFAEDEKASNNTQPYITIPFDLKQ